MGSALAPPTLAITNGISTVFKRLAASNQTHFLGNPGGLLRGTAARSVGTAERVAAPPFCKLVRTRAL